MDDLNFSLCMTCDSLSLCKLGAFHFDTNFFELHFIMHFIMLGTKRCTNIQSNLGRLNFSRGICPIFLFTHMATICCMLVPFNNEQILTVILNAMKKLNLLVTNEIKCLTFLTQYEPVRAHQEEQLPGFQHRPHQTVRLLPPPVS